MSKKVRAIFVAYIIALTALPGGIWLASPSSDSKEILGLIVRSGLDDSQNVFISNRWIQCSPARWDQAAESTCTIDLFGETLEIVAARNPLSSSDQLGGNCTALYNNKKQTCTIGSNGGQIQWVANVYVQGISETQHRMLKWRHIFGNLPQGYYFYGAFLVPLLTAAVLAIATYLGIFRPVSKPPKLAYKLSFVLTSAFAGLIGGFLLLILCMSLAATFW